MNNKEFEEFKQRCIKYLIEKQKVFNEEIKNYTKFYYDLKLMQLELKSFWQKRKYRITVIGTYSTVYSSWLWGWANKDFPDNCTNDSLQLKKLYLKTQYNIFDDEGIKCSSIEADELSAISINFLNAKGLYKVKDQEPWLFLAVYW